MHKRQNMRQIIILLVILNSSQIYGQKDTLYSLGKSDVFLSKTELNSKIERLSKVMKNDTLEWFVRFELEFEDKKNDTLIQHGTLHIIETSLLSDEDKKQILLNKQIPEFQFLDIEGKLISEKEFKGKVVLINFWFTRCPPCLAEMPFLNEIKENYKGQEVEFLSMAPEEKTKVIEFLKIHDFRFRHIPDADNFLKKFGVGFPKNILVDKNGIIRYIGGGIVDGLIEEGDEGIIEQHQISWDELRIQIDKLLIE